MNPVAKALWFIESHFSGDVSLSEIAGVAGVSRFHMVRAFGVTTGHSVMRYVRGRRLSEAARSLANGAPDILAVALDAGYGSHGAFTRAFRDQFGLTPDRVRSRGTTEHLSLMEPIKMDATPRTNPQVPRLENGRPRMIAGLGTRCTWEDTARVPALWQRFNQYFGHVPGQVGAAAYGVCRNGDDTGSFEYVAGVEVADFAALPGDFTRLRIGAQRYAVFKHEEHVSSVRGTLAAIFNDWLPSSGHQAADAPNFERYGETFDPRSGTGGFEIWIPVKS